MDDEVLIEFDTTLDGIKVGAIQDEHSGQVVGIRVHLSRQVARDLLEELCRALGVGMTFADGTTEDAHNPWASQLVHLSAAVKPERSLN